MTLAHTASPPPPRANRGCLWGCLAVLAFFLLPVLVTAGYGGWFVYQGYRHDPVLRDVTDLVRRNGMAAAILGADIHVTGMDGGAFSFVPGLGEAGSYALRLTGSKATGHLQVTAHRENGVLKVEQLILTGPDGGRYDLLHHRLDTPPDSVTDSI